jgi:hypothetical protein
MRLFPPRSTPGRCHGDAMRQNYPITAANVIAIDFAGHVDCAGMATVD